MSHYILISVFFYSWYMSGAFGWFLIMRDMKRMGQEFLKVADIYRLAGAVVIGPLLLIFVLAILGACWSSPDTKIKL